MATKKKTKARNPVIRVKIGEEKTILGGMDEFAGKVQLLTWALERASGKFAEWTSRDLFALAALAGDTEARSPGDRASHAYLVADAMLKERAKERKPQGERSEFDPGPNS